MLLYTRTAPPKEPKRRSRGGCTHCKEKKKKCNETQPKCSRCAEHGTECTYKAVKPRQRRRRESSLSCATPRGAYPSVRRLSEASYGSSGYIEDLYDSEETCEGGSPVSRGGHGDVAMVPRSGSVNPELAMIAPCPTESPLLGFCPPLFSEFSDRPNRRALMDHFCNVLSHLIVFREESGNPFQQLVLPLTRKSSPVMNAIYALASAHLEYRGVGNTEKSFYFHNEAVQGLARVIEHNGKVNRNEILAAIMLLVYYEVLVQRGRSNIVAGHLKGALTIMCTNPESSDPTSAFLERAFRFYDVIAALSNGTAPLSAAPAPGCLQPFPPLGAPAASPLCNIDTLLGMATTLWPIIHRLSDMLSLKSELEQAVQANDASSKIAVLRTEFESTTDAIETALSQWRPHLPLHFIPDGQGTKPAHSLDDITANILDRQGSHPPSPSGRSHIHSILHNALAYRHSSLVYLHRTIRARPRSHPAVQRHAHLSLAHCAATVQHAGPMGALLWPLFVAACEAVSPEDRELAGQAFAAVEKRQGMMNIGRAWEIVHEVWRRADEAEVFSRSFLDLGHEWQGGFQGQYWKGAGVGGCSDGVKDADLWRQVSRDMGVSIVFG